MPRRSDLLWIALGCEAAGHVTTAPPLREHQFPSNRKTDARVMLSAFAMSVAPMPSALIFLISLTSMGGLTRCLRPPLAFRFCEFRSGHRATWLASARSCSCARISNFSTIRCRCATMRLSVSPRSAAISPSLFPAANRRKSNFSRGLTFGKTFIPIAVAGRALNAPGYAILSNSVSRPSRVTALLAQLRSHPRSVLEGPSGTFMNRQID